MRVGYKYKLTEKGKMLLSNMPKQKIRAGGGQINQCG